MPTYGFYMSVDMSQFHGVFFEESQEHLDEMEHLLMELDLDEPDPEDLNSISVPPIPLRVVVGFLVLMTTNLTSFFREPHHFDRLIKQLQTSPRPHTIWCAAASTGEEPYSIAMAAAEAFGRIDPPVNIIATDIDSQVLQTAQQGIYPIKHLDMMSNARKRRFFFRGRGANLGKVKVAPELVKLIEFKPLNLLDKKWDIPDNLDIIFCRNIMIYFDKPTQVDVLGRMVELMRPDGLYFAGHSENFNNVPSLLRSLGQTVYRIVR